MDSAVLDRDLPSPTAVTWSAREAATLAGISYRQLDYWLRLGVLPDDAKGSGTRRRIDSDTVRKLCTLAGVAKVRPDAGILRQVAEMLEWEHAGWVVIDGRGATIAPTERHLVAALAAGPAAVVPVVA